MLIPPYQNPQILIHEDYWSPIRLVELRRPKQLFCWVMHMISSNALKHRTNVPEICFLFLWPLLCVFQFWV
jgi:hypothetical protein